MGLCQHHPKLGEGEKTLKWGNIINVIVPHRNENYILQSGVQINYNGSNMWLTMNYEKYVYDQSRTGFGPNLCLCPVLVLMICHNTPEIVAPALPDDDADVLQIETKFADRNTGNVLVIRGVSDNHVEAEIIEPLELHGEIVSYTDRDFVAQCVRRYN